MNVQHLAFKVFVEGPFDVDWEHFIHVFHTWVAAQAMPEMMIDVADYRHVPNGPGVVLVGHEADYYMDNTDGSPGLRYVCKAAKDGSFEDQLRDVFSAAMDACGRLEAETPGLRFSRKEFELAINDRAIAPNTEETQANLQAELPAILKKVLGDSEMQITYQQDPRKLAGAAVCLAGGSKAVA